MWLREMEMEMEMEMERRYRASFYGVFPSLTCVGKESEAGRKNMIEWPSWLIRQVNENVRENTDLR
jgi:hypothetical protein